MTSILVVDDERAIVELLNLFLSNEGYVVRIAYNGKEGLAALELAPPDVVLCDVMMPVLGGWEMGQKMQFEDRYRSIPLILMSAVSLIPPLPGFVPAALIPKPFDLDNLLDTIEKVVSTADEAHAH